MQTHIICLLVGVLMFIFGWIISGRKKTKDAITATKVIESLKSTVLIYKATNEEQKFHSSQIITELKMDVFKLTAENQELKTENEDLKAEIEKLKEYP